MTKENCSSMSLYQPDWHDNSGWMHGTGIQMDFTLKKPIDEKALLQAAIKMRECYAALQTRPVFQDGEIKYVINSLPLKLLRYEPNAELSYGGENTNFYPWFVAAAGNTLSFVCQHALTDGLGYLAMLKTLLYYYVLETGVDCPSEGVYTLEKPLKHQDFMPNEEYAKLQTEGAPAPKEKFQIGARFRGGITYPSSCGKRFVKLSFDRQLFMNKVKELNTTPFTLMTLVCFKAMQPLMKDADPKMQGRIEASYRRVFNCETTHNLLGSCSIVYSPKKYEGWPEDKICADFRATMNNTLKKDNAILALRSQNKSYKAVRLLKPFALRKKLYTKFIETVTPLVLGDAFFLSYVGRFEFPKPVEDMIVDTNLILQYKTLAMPVMFEIFCINERFIFTTLNYLKDDSLFDNLTAVLKEYGIEARMEQSYRMNDMSFDYSAIKTLSNPS